MTFFKKHLTGKQFSTANTNQYKTEKDVTFIGKSHIVRYSQKNVCKKWANLTEFAKFVTHMMKQQFIYYLNVEIQKNYG